MLALLGSYLALVTFKARRPVAATVQTELAAAGEARALAGTLRRLGLAEDSKLAGLLGARALVAAGRVDAAERQAHEHASGGARSGWTPTCCGGWSAPRTHTRPGGIARRPGT